MYLPTIYKYKGSDFMVKSKIKWKTSSKKEPEENEKSSYKYEGVLGIDLGTTNCVTSYIDEDGEIKLVENDLNEDKTPSFIEVKGNNEYLVGSEAKKRLPYVKNGVLYSFKPYIGTKKILYEDGDVIFNSQFCETIMLKHLAKMAKDKLGFDEDKKLDVVITVPAYFDENKKYDTREAAKMAGLNVIRLLEEPSASAFHTLSVKNKDISNKIVIVYDLGGGTFDVSLVSIFGDSASVVNIGGDARLGGDDYDLAIEELVLNKYSELNLLKDYDEDLLNNIMKQLSEKIKIDISKQYQEGDLDKEFIGSSINSLVISELYDDLPDDIREKVEGIGEIEINYYEAEEVTRELTDRTIKIFDEVISDYDLDIDDIDNIIMTGGSSNLPFVKEALTEYVRQKSINANSYERLKDDINDFIVNPDLSVGYGAAVYAKMVVDGDEDRRITNIVTHNFGIENNKGLMEILIPKGKEIFRREFAMKSFIPDRDNAEEFKVNIYEGEDPVAKNNSLVRTIIIPIPPETKKENYVCEISFTLTKDKVLTISIQTPDKVYREKVEVKTENTIVNPESAYNMTTYSI